MADFYSGIKHFWVVDNNWEVVAALDKISGKGKARSISTFDFSTLYTKIPHEELKTKSTNWFKTSINLSWGILV